MCYLVDAAYMPVMGQRVEFADGVTCNKFAYILHIMPTANFTVCTYIAHYRLIMQVFGK